MNRRTLLRASALITATLWTAPSVIAGQTHGATPQASQSPEDQPVDTRARELVARLHGLSPLGVLEALETAEVTEQALTGAGAPVAPRPWNDPLDTDLEHALGGVLIVASDDPVNSPDLVTLGAYIVFESAEIAYDQLMRQMEDLGQNMASMSVAGTKAWLVQAEDMQLAVMRLGYVLIMADITRTQGNVAEGIVLHLDAVTRTMV